MPSNTRRPPNTSVSPTPPPAIVPPWRRWGCYVTERAWGTVREDYSANGDAWNFLPHDHARSKATAGARTASPGCAIAISC